MLKNVESGQLDRLMGWLQRDEPINLPMIGDLLRHGVDTPFQEFWVQKDASGEWCAVLRRFFEHYIVFVPDDRRVGRPDACADFEELASFLQFSFPQSVSGRKDVVHSLAADLPGIWDESAIMMLPGDDRLFPPEGGSPFRQETQAQGLVTYAEMADAGEMGRLIFGTDVFRPNYHSAEEVAEGIRGRLRSGGVRHAVVRLDGRIVAHANTTTETGRHALISGVTTAPEEQRKGHAFRVVSFLCRELLREGRMPCLFAKSPGALALYRRLGFVETGAYSTWRRATSS